MLHTLSLLSNSPVLPTCLTGGFSLPFSRLRGG
jgi:hypothetical protein